MRTTRPLALYDCYKRVINCLQAFSAYSACLLRIYSASSALVDPSILINFEIANSSNRLEINTLIAAFLGPLFSERYFYK
jgi:hypothetical protein